MREFLKVGVSGVRGVVGESFTPQLATAFARAFGTYVGRGNVLVGRDTRPSGAMFERAVAAGLLSVGCRPVHAGILPTPSLLHLARDPRARGAIMITASHNPAPWNALKFIDPRGLFLSPASAEELFDIYHQGDYDMVDETGLQTAIALDAPCADHFQRVRDYVDTERIAGGGFRVAVDACNGVGALHTRAFLEALGCEVHLCLDTPNGLFEREPEPLPENLGALRALVRDTGCAVGFAQDPDGDRLALVDAEGCTLGEDLTVALAAWQVLDAHAQGPIATTVSASRAIRDVADRAGVPFIETRIGEIHVCEAMLEANAVAGGEGNGGAIIPGIHPCRDSYAGMALILERMAATGRSLADLRSDLPRYHVVKRKLRIRGDRAPRVLRAVRHQHTDAPLSTLDGVRIDYADAWIHVRPSNTEPVLRITAESTDAARADALADDMTAFIEGLPA